MKSIFTTIGILTVMCFSALMLVIAPAVIMKVTKSAVDFLSEIPLIAPYRLRDPHTLAGSNSWQHTSSIHSKPSSSNNSPVYSYAVGSLRTNVKLGSHQISDTGYLQLDLQGLQDDMQASQRAPLHLVLVVDQSGSMQGEKLTYVKEALMQLDSFVSSRDRVTLIAYDDQVTVLSDDFYDRESFQAQVKSISSRGSTNLEGGLRKGFEIVQSNSSHEFRGQAKHLLVLSDGQANVGISSAKGLADLVGTYARTGVTVSSVGVGADYDEAVMAALAQSGSGNYYFLEDPKQAATLLNKELGELTQQVASDITVSIDLASGFELKESLGYEMIGTNIQPNNLAAGKNSRFLFKISETATSGEREIGMVHVSYVQTSTGEYVSYSVPFYAEVVTGDTHPLVDPEVYEQYMQLYIAQRMWQVDQELEKVNNKQALQELETLQVELQQAQSRIPGIFEDTVLSVEEKKSYIINLGERNVKEDEYGRVLKKSIQSESADQLYNR